VLRISCFANQSVGRSAEDFTSYSPCSPCDPHRTFVYFPQMSDPNLKSLLYFFLICCIPSILIYVIGKWIFKKSNSKSKNLTDRYQTFRKKSNLIFITSLFAILSIAAPLFQIHDWISTHQIPFLLFAAVIGFFLFVSISIAKYAIYKNIQEKPSSFLIHLRNTSSEWIITFLPFVFYFTIVVLGRNLPPVIGKYLSTYRWTPIFAVIIWFIQYTFSPLFWRWLYQTDPLTDSKIRPELDKIVKDSGTTLENLSVIQFESDAPANAFALGLWPKLRTIFLSKALLESFNLSEIKAIFLHEIGHFKNKHMRKQYFTLLAFQIVLIGASWSVGHRMPPNFQNLIFIDGLPFIIFFFNQWIVKIKMGCRHEKEADVFVVRTIKNPEDFISALEKIHRINYLPRQWKGKSHPSLEKRISTIRQQVEASAKKDKTEL